MSIPTQAPAREYVIDELATAALDGMTTAAAGATNQEVVSAVFTLCTRVLRVLIEMRSVQDRAHNVEVIRTAIGQLYALLPPVTNAN